MRPVTALLAAAASALVAAGLVLPAPSAVAAPSASPGEGATSGATPGSGPGTASGDDDAGEPTLELAPAGAGTLAPDEDLELRLRVTNDSDDDLRAGTVRVYLDRPSFETASAVDAWLHPDDPGGSDYLGSLVASVQVPAVEAGETLDLDPVTVPEARVGLAGQAWGARALGARWLVGGDEAAQARSSVTWFPSQDFAATRVAAVAPITTPESSTGVLDAAALAAYTSSGGTLTRQLEPLLGTSVAIGVDPMIVASIRLLGDEAPESAVAWLRELEQAPNEVFALTYADSDMAGLSQAGSGAVLAPTSFADQIDPSRFDSESTATPAPAPSGSPSAATGTGSSSDTAGADTGRGGVEDEGADAAPEPSAPAPEPTTPADPGAPPLPTAESLLSLDSELPSLAWPVRGTTVTADLPVFTASGYASTILSGDQVADDDGTTDDAHAVVSGADALVAHDAVTDLVEEAGAARDDLAFDSAVARLSATVATVAHERPSEPRTLLVALDRGWATSSPRVDETLDALEAQPWATGASLADALAVAPGTATLVDRPEADDRVAALRELVAADRRVTDFATVLAEPAVATGSARLRTLALASPAWTDNVDGFRDEVAAATAEAEAIASSVSVVEGSDVAILGDRSSLPVYVQNSTDSAATVYLTVVPSNSFLAVEETSIPVTVQAQSQGRVMVPVTSIANGPVVVTMTLASQTGLPVGTPASVSITVQAGWETAITWTLGGLVVLLFGGGILRSVLKRRRGEAAGDADPGAEDEDSDAGAGEGRSAGGPDDTGPDPVVTPEHRA